MLYKDEQLTCLNSHTIWYATHSFPMSSDKKLVIYENAFHESLMSMDPVKWQTEVGAFLDTKL